MALRAKRPSARQFFGAVSCCVWTDDAGADHDVLRAEGGQQGDPFMPAPYALTQHAALADVATALAPGDAVLALFDNTHIMCSPERGRLNLWRPQRRLVGSRRESNSTRARPAKRQPLAVYQADTWRIYRFRKTFGLASFHF